MNKLERRLKAECKRKQRAIHYPGWNKNFRLRDTGKPCSCFMCSPCKVIPYRMKHSDELKSSVFDVKLGLTEYNERFDELQDILHLSNLYPLDADIFEDLLMYA